MSKCSHPLAALLSAAALAAITACTPAQPSEVNLYTTREPKLIQPLLDAFTASSGITVNTVFVKDGLLERVKTEGERSPADVLMTVDIGNLMDLVDGGVTQAVTSDTLAAAIPAHLRDPRGHWFGLSLRDRVLYADTALQLAAIRYEDLADPRWKGKICIRSGQHPYNTALIAAMIAHNGAAATEAWLQGVKANLARKATGGDRDVARDILGGICEIGLANAYYVGRMKNAATDSEERRWGGAIKVVRPTFGASAAGGTHVNISGAALAKYAPHRADAIRLLEYLVSKPAQSLYARANYEYPVRTAVELDPVVASFGTLMADPLPAADIAKYRRQASELVDKVGFDN